MSRYQNVFKLAQRLSLYEMKKSEVKFRNFSNNSSAVGIKHPTDKNVTSMQNTVDNIPDLINEEIKIPYAQEECQEDLPFVGPYMRPTFNFAAYANKSTMIQELVKLGVELYKVEAKKRGLETLLKLSFEDIKLYIQFLYDCGVPVDEIGSCITKNPFIFEEDMDDLKTRIRYLRAHNFSPEDIARVVTKNPHWLSHTTTEIDKRLGFLQTEFELKGNELRFLIVKRPALGTYKLDCIIDSTFAVREQMGFDKYQIKRILLNKPMIWLKDRHKIVQVFDYVHNSMGLTHDILTKQPAILATRLERVKQRHEYLLSLKRNQYDPTKPLYVSPDSIAEGTDFTFCLNVAKTSLQLYDLFLKTL